MTNDLLSEILDDDYFKQVVALVTKSIDFNEGQVVDLGNIETQIDCVIQSVKHKELVSNGLGEYTENQAYSLFTKIIIDQSKNNFIRYENKLFKIKQVGAWNNYGFNKYIIYQYNDEVLNDN
jgi:hypothetical protein